MTEEEKEAIKSTLHRLVDEHLDFPTPLDILCRRRDHHLQAKVHFTSGEVALYDWRHPSLLELSAGAGREIEFNKTCKKDLAALEELGLTLMIAAIRLREQQ